ncbi:MEDS domain-containing protein [Paractinoplanes rishiriensis]|uniref:STAS domain-containing protein n=1 Tax=Paractinoplanes rishiriensis TaxID=1050105 RepID=A0A919K5T0_9ACTN|nr:MEDS domain-containing protein [Actinoplanes rishiriensis]GIE99460.1 hypothetical protein Ari01nite_69250 [Actinoplanes rishiriensis]
MLAVRGVPDLTVHDHLCFVYDRDAEVRQALVEYALAGLARWEQVRVFTVPGAASATILDDLRDVGLPVDDLVDYGLLIVDSAESAYLAEGVFDADERLERCAGAARSAIAQGHTGLRVYVETHFLLRHPDALSAWPAYELHTDLLVKQLPITAMCGYDARRWPTRNLMLAEPLHTRRSRQHSAFRLNVGRDGTLRLSGDVDFLTAAQVDRLLAQTAPSRPTAVLDVSGVCFIDVSGARAIGRFCEAIADEHGPTTLRGATPLLRKIWKPAGWSEYFPHAILED